MSEKTQPNLHNDLAACHRLDAGRKRLLPGRLQALVNVGHRSLRQVAGEGTTVGIVRSPDGDGFVEMRKDLGSHLLPEVLLRGRGVQAFGLHPAGNGWALGCQKYPSNMPKYQNLRQISLNFSQNFVPP